MSEIKLGNKRSTPVTVRLVRTSEESTVTYVDGVKPSHVTENDREVAFTLAGKQDLYGHLVLAGAGTPLFKGEGYVTNINEYKLTNQGDQQTLEFTGNISTYDPNYNHYMVGLFLKIDPSTSEFVLANPDKEFSVLIDGEVVRTVTTAEILESRAIWFNDTNYYMPVIIDTMESLIDGGFNQITFNGFYNDLAKVNIQLDLTPTVVEPLSELTLFPADGEFILPGNTVHMTYEISPENAVVDKVEFSSSNDAILTFEDPSKPLATAVAEGDVDITLTVTDVLGNVLTSKETFRVYFDGQPMLITMGDTEDSDEVLHLTGVTRAYAVSDGRVIQGYEDTVDGIRLHGDEDGTAYQVYTEGTISTVDYSGLTSLTAIDDWGNTGAVTFNIQGLPNLVTLPATLPSTLGTLSSFAKGCTSLNTDLSGWDVKNYQNFTSTFEGCASLNMPFTGWNLNIAGTLNSMLRGCSSFNQPLPNILGTKLTNVAYMLDGCTAFNQSVDNVDVSNVTTFTGMLQGCTSFNKSLDTWRTGNAVNMDYMFKGADSFTYSLRKWCVTNVTVRPIDFGLAESNSPVWGTCPSDSDVTAIIGLPSSVQIGDEIPLTIETNYDIVTKEWEVTPAGYGMVGDDDILYILNGEVDSMITVKVTVNTLNTAVASTVMAKTVSGLYLKANTAEASHIVVETEVPVTINWGDGQTETTEGGLVTHDYSDANEYDVSIVSSEDVLGKLYLGGCVSSIINWGDAKITALRLGHGDIGASENMFNDMLPALPQSLTDMSHAFANCGHFNQDISYLDFSKVTQVDHLFADCYSLDQSLAKLNLAYKDITDYTGMFSGCTAFNGDIDQWNMQYATKADNMLVDCNQFNVDLSLWCVPNITEEPTSFATSPFLTEYMLPVWGTCPATDVKVTLLIDNDNIVEGRGRQITVMTTPVTTITSVEWTSSSELFTVSENGLVQNFGGDETLITAVVNGAYRARLPLTGSPYDPDATDIVLKGLGARTASIALNGTAQAGYTVHWGDGDTTLISSAVAASHTYSDDYVLNDENLIVVKPASGVTSVTIQGMEGFIAIEQWADLPHAKVELALANSVNSTLTTVPHAKPNGLTTLANTFANCTAFTGANVDYWMTGDVTSLYRTFYNCTALNFNAVNMDTSKVTNFQETFAKCPVFNSDLNGWNVSNGENFSGMLSDCAGYNQPIMSWVFKAWSYLDNFLKGATSFNSDISGCDFGQVSSLESFLEGATSFNQDLADMDVTNVHNFDRMLYGCTAFSHDLSMWCTANVDEAPEDFGTGSGMTVTQYPEWGMCPLKEPVSTVNAKSITQPIVTEDNFTMNLDGKLLISSPVPIDSILEYGFGDTTELVELEPIEQGGSSETDAIDLYGRWYLMINDELVGFEDLSIDELEEKLATYGIELIK